MHNNYYFLKQLVPSLKEQLEGAVLTKCFSQNKDELILEFQLENQLPFFIKAYQKNNFSCLSFPQNYSRAKKNSIDLFTSIIGKIVSDVQLYNNERAFTITINNCELVFKLFGNKSNIILFENDDATELFKNSLKRDKLIKLNELEKELDISLKNLKANDWDIRKVIPTLDKQSAELLTNQLVEANYEQSAFDEFITELNSQKIYLQKNDKGYKLSLINTEWHTELYNSPIIAITSFFEKEVKLKALLAVKSRIINDFNTQLTKSKNYVIKVSQKLKSLQSGSSNQQKADILMANLHSINKGSKTVDLHNFYDNSLISINLNPLQSPQKNAERYYRKSKNEAKEIAILTRNIKAKQLVISSLETNIKEVEEDNNIKSLLKWKPKQKSSSSDIVLPYKEYFVNDYKILVGKNAKHNDTLTLHIAKKDDLWLHAKDVSGSHVVIKQIPGKKIPEYIIEKAAQLAAFYSKRKTDTLCPVLYTPKKYVRKKKGTPAGAMFVEKERVILVEPSNNL